MKGLVFILLTFFILPFFHSWFKFHINLFIIVPVFTALVYLVPVWHHLEFELGINQIVKWGGGGERIKKSLNMSTCSADLKGFHLLICQPAIRISFLPGANILYLQAEEKPRVSVPNSAEVMDLLKSVDLLKSFLN